MRTRSLTGVAAPLVAVATASALLVPSAAWSDATPAPDGSFDGTVVCPPERVEVTKDRRLEVGERARVKLKIDFPEGEAPSGAVKLVVRTADAERVFKATKPLNAKGAVTHRTGKLAAGKFEFTATYLPTPESSRARFTRIWWTTVS